MSQTVSILPGFVSGNGTTRRLRKSLQQAGYVIVDDPANATIILAHSAGCLWLPQASPHQKYILIDPPYWPGKTVRDRIRMRSRSNAHFYQYDIPLRRWLTRQAWGMYYAARNPWRTGYILLHMGACDLQDIIRKHEVILVRNEHDDWLTPKLNELRRASPKLKIVELPGEHDDFNYHPKRYVDLLQSLV